MAPFLPGRLATFPPLLLQVLPGLLPDDVGYRFRGRQPFIRNGRTNRIVEYPAATP